MRHHLNTLYVTTPGAYLAKDGQTVAVRVEQETRLRIPVHNLESIVCFGPVSMSPFLMALCAKSHVGVSFLTQNGRFLARVIGAVSGNVLVRREQYRRADDLRACAAIARAIVAAKIANCRVCLMRAARDRPDGSSRIGDAAKTLALRLAALQSDVALDEVRGIEGLAAREYFSVFDSLITQQRDCFRFRGRSRRPPLDPMNALLSFLYTLLLHDVRSALESVGLDPAVGFLHRDRPGRPGLALDLMEELRPFVADRLAISLINLRQLDRRRFRTAESGAVLLDEKGRKEVLIAYQKRKQEEILHPFVGERIPIGLLPQYQALLMTRHLRGDLDAYPPFFWK